MDIGYLFSWYANSDQFVPDGIIDVKVTVVMRGREIAEDHLC